MHQRVLQAPQLDQRLGQGVEDHGPTLATKDRLEVDLLQRLGRELAGPGRIPTLFVSHDATESRLLSREVAVLNQGRIIALGKADDVFTRPDVLPLARDEGYENVVTGRPIDGDDSDAVALQLEDGISVVVPSRGITGSTEVTAGVSAEDLILAMEPPVSISARNILPGVVREIRVAEDASLILVIVDEGRKPTRLVTAVTHRAQQQLGVTRGRKVHLVAKVQSFRIISSR